MRRVWGWITWLLLLIGGSLVGCGDAAPPSEVTAQPERCDDGIDNTGDGLVDCDDPTCAAVPRCRRIGLGEICDDGIDNDENSLIDCDDPACAEARACVAILPCEQRCDDPACAETAVCQPPPPVEICGDGLDNDSNSLTDCMDPACAEEEACQPPPPVEICGDTLDNDENGLIDCMDPACAEEAACRPTPAEVCGDGLDNDEDGLTDCMDPACLRAESCAPTGEGTCASPRPIKSVGTYAGTTAMAAAFHEGSCGGVGGEEVWTFSVPAPTPLCVNTRASRADTLLHVRAARCLDPTAEVVCGEDLPSGALQAEVEVMAEPGVDYFVFVEGDGEAYALTIRPGPCDQGEVCDDALDNDLNGAADCSDLACSTAAACEGSTERCADGRDNDGNGQVDCLDPACAQEPDCAQVVRGTCAQPLALDASGLLRNFIRYDHADLSTYSAHRGSCIDSVADGPEDVWRLVPLETSTVCVHSVATSPALGPIKLHARRGECESAAREVACDDPNNPSGSSQIEFVAIAGTPYFIFADSGLSNDGEGGQRLNPDPYELRVRFGPCDVAPEAEVCDDDVDNDQDGLTDCADSACAASPVCRLGAGTCGSPWQPSTQGRLPGALSGSSALQSACGGAGPEEVWTFEAPLGGPVCVLVEEATLPVALSAWGGSCGGSAEAVGCVTSTDGSAALELEVEPGARYDVAVDALAAGTGTYRLELHPGTCASRVEVCHDAVDNDGNGLVDCADPGCSADTTCVRVEQGTCAWPLEARPGESVVGTTAVAPDRHDAGCAQDGYPEEVWSFTPPLDTRVCASLDAYGSYTVLYAKEASCEGAEIACDEHGERSDQRTSQVSFMARAGVTYWLFAEGQYDSARGPYRLTLHYGDCQTMPSQEVCHDDVDNDQDGVIDCEDTDCQGDALCSGDRCEQPRELLLGTARSALPSGEGQREGSCGGSGAEQSWALLAPRSGTLCLEAATDGFDALLHLHEEACDDAEIACSDDRSFLDNRPQLEVPVQAGERVVVLVDAYDQRGGSYELTARLGPCALQPTPERCDDLLDNDQNGLLDCEDPACVDAPRCIPSSESRCDDLRDDDRDALVDCADPDCRGAAPCAALTEGTCELPRLATLDQRGSTAGLPAVLAPSCASSSVEEVWLLQPVRDGTLCVEVLEPTFNPVLSVRALACAATSQEVGCADRGGNGGAEQLQMEVQAAAPYFIVVDTYGAASAGGSYRLRLRYGACGVTPEPERCDDGADNDQDGLADCADPDCAQAEACILGAGSCADPFILMESRRGGISADAPAVYEGTCGGAGREEVWAFEAERDGPHCLTTLGSAYDTVLYVRASECASGPELACADNTVGLASRLEVETTAGATYYVFVDAAQPAGGGSYQLELLPGPCADFVEVCADGVDNDRDGATDCADLECLGEPVCLEQCDDFEDNDLNGLVDCSDPACAQDDACVARLGDCAAPWLLERAGTFTGDTSAAASDHRGSCRNVDGQEGVWLLHLEQTTPVCLTADADFSTTLYARRGGCEAGVEVACDEGLGSINQIGFTAEAGTPYFVFVDGLNGGSSFAGPYSLELRLGPCGVAPVPEVCDDGQDNDQDGALDCADPECASRPGCLQGEGTCASPWLMPAPGRFVGQSDAAAALEEGSCGGEGAEEVWSFIAPTSGRFCLDTEGSAYDTLLYVRRESCDGGAEIACADDGPQGVRAELELDLEAGVRYFALVDTRLSASGAYVLRLTPGSCAARREVCGDGRDNDHDGALDCADPECGADPSCEPRDGTCEAPFTIPAAGSFQGDTTGAPSRHEGTCRPVEGTEEVWAFQAEIDTTVCLEASHPGEVFYVRSGGCGGGGYREEACSYRDSTPQLEFVAAAGEPYFVFVDNFNSGVYGPYTFSVRFGPCAVAPTPERCDDGLDNDQDGRVDCMDEACVGQAHCVAGSGSCGDPYVASAPGVLFQTLGSASTQRGSCGGDGEEDVWLLQRSTGGSLCVSAASASHDMILYAHAGACAAGPELACDGAMLGGAAEIDLTVDAEVPYFIVVDSPAQASAGADYRLTLSEGACSDRREVCGNGMDDDQDGLPECADPDCAGTTLCPAGAVGLPAPGQHVTLSGSLDAGGPVWSRPGESCAGGGGGYLYSTHALVNLDQEPRTIQLTASWQGDGYLHIFQHPFDLGSLQGCLRGDDDYNSVLMSRLDDVVLQPGEALVVVASTYDAGAALGAYTVDVFAP